MGNSSNSFNFRITPERTARTTKLFRVGNKTYENILRGLVQIHVESSNNIGRFNNYQALMT